MMLDARDAILAWLRGDRNASLPALDGGVAERDIYGYVPEEVNALPCVIAGYPELEKNFEEPGAIFELELIVVGHPFNEEGHNQREMIQWAEGIVEMFGSFSRAVNITRHEEDAEAIYVEVTSTRPRSFSIGGKTYQCYVVGLRALRSIC